MIAEEDMVIAITRSGYIKRLPVTTYREQRRGGIGVMGMDMKDEDYIEHLFVASTHDYILFFTSVGKVYRLKVHELPLGSRQSKGRAGRAALNSSSSSSAVTRRMPASPSRQVAGAKSAPSRIRGPRRRTPWPIRTASFAGPSSGSTGPEAAGGAPRRWHRQGSPA